MNTRRVVMIGIAVLCVLGTSAVAAQERYRRDILAQLNLVELAMDEAGFERTHDYKIDKLGGDRTDSFTITLRRDNEYRIVAVCDRDCGDVDIRLYDENNNEVAKDVATDDFPMVRIEPRWTGTFKIHVRMYDCKVNPCYYGIGTFGK